MKISKSKKELARIISENGGWRDGGEFSSQGRKTGAIGFVRTRPRRCGDIWRAVKSDLVGVIHPDVLISNWHQTILSRAEYFHLYPEHTETEYRDGVKPTDPAKVDGPSKPTIEQLATNYRNAKDYAERKQREADDAKADADAKLKVLELAGESLGLKVSPITAKQGPELVTTKFTGRFHSAKHGDRPEYLDMICDGCGKRFGTHVGFDCCP
ncbi:MAG: hypothetical protein ACRC9H_12990 [Aeromonas veronii]